MRTNTWLGAFYYGWGISAVCDITKCCLSERWFRSASESTNFPHFYASICVEMGFTKLQDHNKKQTYLMYGACAATNIPTHCALCYFLQWLFVREPLRFKESSPPPNKNTAHDFNCSHKWPWGGTYVFIYLCISFNIENILLGYCVIQEFI